MAFRFGLASLLRLRESLEKAELQKLQAAVAKVAQVRAEIESADAEIEASRRKVLDQASREISGAELQIAAMLESARQSHRAQLIVRLEELEQARKKQQARYAEARQRREIMANLRARQLAVYEREQARREQRSIDELFLIRRGANKRRDRGEKSRAEFDEGLF